MSFTYEPFTHIGFAITVGEDNDFCFQIVCDGCDWKSDPVVSEGYEPDSLKDLQSDFFDHLVNVHSLTRPSLENHIKVLELRKQIVELQTQIVNLEDGYPSAYSR